MTQDQSSSVHGTGYVVRGEVVPDDETEEFQSDESGPMTRLRKVASAMRGDKPDQTVPDETTTTDPNGSFYERSGDPGTMSDPVAADETDAEYADAAPADDVAAVRIPETGDRNYWDDEQASREPAPGAGMTATDPDLGPGPVADDPDLTEGTGPSVAYPTPADTMAEDHRETGTDTVPAGTVPAGPGAAETAPAGKHAAATVADAGLRPGEATDRLGDFGDIAFGNLLPDAAQYSAQWQQIQFRFVDDPQASVTEAADVLSQVTAKLEAAIQERQRAIEERKQAIQERASALRGRWGEGSNADTETLRETLRMYRAFMDQLIGSTS
jgi:hypothetical protein